MNLLLLISLALAGPGKRGKRHEPEPVPIQIPASVQPAGVAPPTAQTPALEGAVDALKLIGLRRTSIRFEFGYDTRAIESLTEEEQAALWRHLAADPRWRVSHIGDVRFAEQRVDQDGRWFVGLGGYHVGDDHCHRIALRSGPRQLGTPWARSDLVAHGKVGQADVELRVFALLRDPCKDQQATALSVDSAVSLEVFESGDADALPKTTQALTDDMTFIRNATIDPPSVLRDGYEVHALGGPLPSTDAVGLRRVDAGLSISGADNPGEAGWLWIRLLQAGEPVQAKIVATSTLEQVGWSTETGDLFYWQSVIPVRDLSGFDGIVEVWFASQDGDVRKLRQVSAQLD